MVRAAALYQQEWSRVDRQPLGRGYGVAGLGRALSRLYGKQSFVKAVEMMVSTALSPGPPQFTPIGRETAARIAAMNRMHEELAFDCSECPYTDVCTEVAALRAMRAALKNGRDGRWEVDGAR